ncbi:glycosyltransferase [Mongoliitalea daihaiensis]|uniref:glycosyltransferase n=1 Tax=Mongoliitalea daihaiensis TaxID=2782006 RepID=UPI001F251B8A|nr:glycosyltransferase [Mongoliitalea daihaiensis]UJP65181.1 glycosyltransferase [Mongoliitalea daihaiensis]
MFTLYIFFGIVYQLLLLGLHRLASVPHKLHLSSKHKPVSIILPFRNEAMHLNQCLESILSNKYPVFEILCVDDHSTDKSCLIVRQIQERFPQFKIRLLSNPGEGKKAAVSYALENSAYELILTTDADCVVSTNWIEAMAFGLQEHTQLVAGPVMSIDKGGFFHGFQQVDWASIGLVTRMGIYTGKPLMCSAANMLYRKSAFQQVEGYTGNEQVLSGDDEFLLKKINTCFGPSAIAFQAEPEALVFTEPIENWRKLFQQRIRWASKWRAHGFNYHVLAALFPTLVQMGFFFLFIFPFLSPEFWWLACLLLAMKVYVERFVLGALLQSYGISQPPKVWLLTSLVHPVYVVAVGIQTFFRKIEWKGRKSFR